MKLDKNEYQVRLLTEREKEAALRLAWKVFIEYESPDYVPVGTEEFRKCLKDNAYLEGLVYYGAFDGEKLVGILGVRKEEYHICFF